MSTVRITSDGFALGEWRLPPFELKQGEVVTLTLPVHSDGIASKLTNALCARTSYFGLHLKGHSVWAEPASPPKGIRRWFQDSSASGWLRRKTGISPGEAKEAIERLGLGCDDLNRLAANPRMLLGLEAAWAKKPDIIVFTLSGCDSTGINAAIRSVERHLESCAAVLLSLPRRSAGETSRLVFPGSTVIEIARLTPISV